MTANKIKAEQRTLTVPMAMPSFECLSDGTVLVTLRRATGEAITFFVESVHQRRDGEGFWNQAGYCNNFIFAALA
jgi:hypothetical protein